MITQWKRGDPHPQDWPEWLCRADIEWCEVEIEDDWVIWHDGFWKDGAWRNGTWENGIWRNGTWFFGLWHLGSWHAGTWYNGIWRNGIWNDGIWRGGVWHDGTWRGGTQQRPRFGWSIEDSRIRGYLPGGMVTLSEDEWRPLLGDMDPLKVAEFELIVQFKRALEKAPAEGPTLWEHLEG